jgi:hypothetical protein
MKKRDNDHVSDGGGNVLFLVAVENQHLVVRTNLPLRWLIVFVGAWAALSGSPQIIRILAESLGG